MRFKNELTFISDLLQKFSYSVLYFYLVCYLRVCMIHERQICLRLKFIAAARFLGWPYFNWPYFRHKKFEHTGSALRIAAQAPLNDKWALILADNCCDCQT